MTLSMDLLRFRRCIQATVTLLVPSTAAARFTTGPELVCSSSLHLSHIAGPDHRAVWLQVFDISGTAPEKVVQRMFDHLDDLMGKDIKGASEVQSQLRVLLMGDHRRVYRTLQVLPPGPPLPQNPAG